MTTLYFKKVLSITFVGLIVLLCPKNAKASLLESSTSEITITSEPNREAIVGLKYYYKLDAEGASEIGFSLLKGPDNMQINNGVLSWQTEDIAESVEVIIEASDINNVASADTQDFYLNITHLTNCISSIHNLYKFDELSEGINNDTKENNDFENILGLSGISEGVLNGSVSLCNSMGYLVDGAEIASPDSYDWASDESFTFSVWVKPIEFNNTRNQVVIGRDSRSTSSQYSHFWLGIDTNYCAQFYLLDNQLNPISDEIYWDGGLKDRTGKKLADGEWHHLVALRNGEEKKNKLFVDGVLVDESIQYDYPSDFSMTAGKGPITIGYMDITEVYFYNGYIDELAILDDALTETEIANYYTDVINLGQGFCSGDNSTPYFSSQPVSNASLNETYTYNISFDDSDDGDHLILSVEALPDWLTLSFNEGEETASLVGTPIEIQHSHVKLKIDDGINQSYQEFNIFITETENQPPTITSVAPSSVLEDSQYSYEIKFTDPDVDDSIFVQIEQLPTWLTFNATNNTISGIPENKHVGEYDFTITIFDLAGNSDSENVILAVVNTNDPPKIISVSPEGVYEDELYRYEVLPVDYDINDSVILSIISLPDWIEFDEDNRILSGTPENKDVGKYEFSIVAKDKEEETFTEQVLLTVINTNDPPVILSVIDTAEIQCDSVLTILLSNLNVEDVDNNFPDGFTLTILGGDNYTCSGTDCITPTSEFEGMLYVNVQVSDGVSASNVFSVPVIVLEGVGIINTSAFSEIQLYPNPTNGVINITLNGDIPQETYLKIVDTSGRLINIYQLGKNENQIDLSALKAGNYFYQVCLEREIISSGTFVLE